MAHSARSTATRRISDLLTAPTIDNAMAHQRYLEMLSFEAHSLHPWSRIFAEHINDEREGAHHLLESILDRIAAQRRVDWTRSQSAQDMAPRPMVSLPPHPLMGSMQTQMQPQGQTLQDKPAPTSRSSGTQPSSSSTPPANQPFPPQQGADPWFQGWIRWKDMHKWRSIDQLPRSMLQAVVNQSRSRTHML